MALKDKIWGRNLDPNEESIREIALTARHSGRI